MRIRKIFYLLFISLLPCLVISCDDDDDDNSYSEWRLKNEAAIDSIKNVPGYQVATVPEGPGNVYYKVLKEGTGTESPIYTSQVSLKYKGSLIDETVFDDRSKVNTSFYVYGVVPGMTVALQNMKVGDKWEVWIPWQLGYGTSSTTSIPSYSALIFELELVSILKY